MTASAIRQRQARKINAFLIKTLRRFDELIVVQCGPAGDKRIYNRLGKLTRESLDSVVS